MYSSSSTTATVGLASAIESSTDRATFGLLLPHRIRQFSWSSIGLWFMTTVGLASDTAPNCRKSRRKRPFMSIMGGQDPKGGPTTLANLALACVGCSLHKAAWARARDPGTRRAAWRTAHMENRAQRRARRRSPDLAGIGPKVSCDSNSDRGPGDLRSADGAGSGDPRTSPHGDPRTA